MNEEKLLRMYQVKSSCLVHSPKRNKTEIELVLLGFSSEHGTTLVPMNMQNWSPEHEKLTLSLAGTDFTPEDAEFSSHFVTVNKDGSFSRKSVENMFVITEQDHNTNTQRLVRVLHLGEVMTLALFQHQNNPPD